MRGQLNHGKSNNLKKKHRNKFVYDFDIIHSNYTHFTYSEYCMALA